MDNNSGRTDKVSSDRIERKTLCELAYKRIKDRILNNKLLPKQYISMKELIEDLGTSQTPIREAISRLISEGLIIQAPNKKPRISEISIEDVHEIYELRKLIEPYIAGIAAQSLTNVNRLVLESLRGQALKSDDQRTIAQLNRESIAIDMGLNKVLLRSTGNKMLREMLLFISDRSLRIRTFFETRRTKFPEKTEHLSIIDSILEKNIKKSQESVLHHLRNAERRTIEAIASIHQTKVKGEKEE